MGLVLYLRSEAKKKKKPADQATLEAMGPYALMVEEGGGGVKA